MSTTSGAPQNPSRAPVGESRDLAAAEPERLSALKQRFLALHREVVADGPDFPLEEHRDKARAAFPGAYPRSKERPEPDEPTDDEDGS